MLGHDFNATNVSLNKSCVIGGSETRVLATVVVVTVLLCESLNSVFSSLNWWCNWLLSTSGSGNAANASCTSSSLPAKSPRAAAIKMSLRRDIAWSPGWLKRRSSSLTMRSRKPKYCCFQLSSVESNGWESATVLCPPLCRVQQIGGRGEQTAMLAPDSWQVGGNCPPCIPFPRACIQRLSLPFSCRKLTYHAMNMVYAK